MTNISTLKLPDGIFSHSDLATVNNTTNQKVWVEYSRLRKEGIIVSAGTRSTGKGKPTLLWKLAGGQPVPLVEVVKPVVNIVKPVEVIEPTAIVGVVHFAKTGPKPKKQPEIESLPDIKPVTVPIEVVEVKPEVVEPVVDMGRDVNTLTQVCPICKHSLFAMNDATGIMVWCGQPKEICNTNENPYAHSNRNRNVEDSKTIEDAYETLCQKYRLDR